MYKTLAIILSLAATSVGAEDAVQTSVKSISPKAAYNSVESRHTVIIDVREPSEIARTSIPGAINIPLSQLKNRLVELDKYKQSPIITQCRTGRRSLAALKTLMSSGFTNVQNLEGGIIAWEKAGLKTEKKCC